MRWSEQRAFALAAFIAASCPLLAFASAAVSGGLDARAWHSSDPRHSEAELTGLFLNARQVWSDAAGDRWIGIAQVDADHNFDEVRPYQLYLQYKGPLGKWNVRVGHYLLPFGLLAQQDTERLLLQGIENTNLGIRKDTGVQVLGRAGEWDCAASLSGGASDIRLVDSRADPVVSFRAAYVRSDWQLGFSALAGRPWARFGSLIDSEGEAARFTRERRLAVDLLKTWERLTLRVEGGGGTNDGESVWGGAVLADYSLLPRLELNSRYAYWHRDGVSRTIGAGLTFDAGRGWFLRVAHQHEFGERDRNMLVGQVYYEFSRRL